MTKIIIILGLLFGLGGMIIYVRRQDRKTGQNEQKLKVAEKALDNVKKAKGAIVRLNDDIRRKLREKYNK